MRVSISHRSTVHRSIVRGAGSGAGPVRRGVAAVSVAIIALTTLAACHGATTAAVSLPSKGGTLNVILSNGPVNNLDPQEISLATDADVSHMINRTLTTTNAAGALIPDLATDTGRPSDGNQIWEFTLKPDVKWQDGSPVTCQDVQYGIERRFAPAINQAGGLPYPLTYLVDNIPAYTGPFSSSGASTLKSIVCIGGNNIQFHLQRPVGDFGYTVSVATFAPMKESADTDHAADGLRTSTNYNPFSDGPYKILPSETVTKQDPGTKAYYATQLELVRNPYWNPATDLVRKAYPNKILITFDGNRPKVTNDLIQSANATTQNAINLDSDVSSQFVQQVINDPELSKRAISGFEGATRYFAINARRLTNKSCRQALEYAFDKYAWRYEAGGAVFGQLATSLIPPNLLAHANFDLYNTNSEQNGDTDAATKDWKAGHCPDQIRIAYPNASGLPQQMSTVVRAYQLAGIGVILVPINPNTYFSSIRDPREKYDMTYSGWVPDWPNGSAVIPPLFDSKQVTDALKNPAAVGSNLNFSMAIDPQLDAAIAGAYKNADLNAQYKLWGQLDHQIMSDAYVIPILFSRGLRMTGTKVRGAVMSAAYGMPDLSSIGVVP